MAVHNGAPVLRRKIRQLLELDYPNVEQIVIVSDGSTDQTEEILSSESDPRLRGIVLREHGGKAAALNAGTSICTGEIIVFIDIRPEIAPGAIQQLVGNFADPQVGCVSGNLGLRQDGHDGASAAIGGLYWKYEQWIRTCESAFDSPVGVYGGFYAIRRILAAQQPPGIILDDMFQPLSIIRQGYRSVVDMSACVYDMWPAKVKGEFSRKVRTLAGNFQLFKLAPWTLTFQNRVLFQLVSHKLVRLIVPYLLFASLWSAVALWPLSGLYRTIAVVELLGWALALLGLSYKVPVLRRLADPAGALLVLNAAAVVGLYKFLFTPGPLWKIWNPTPVIEKNPGAIAAVSSPGESG